MSNPKTSAVEQLTPEEFHRGFMYAELHRLLGGARLLNCSMQQFVAACVEAEQGWLALADADPHIREDMAVSALVFLGRQGIFSWQEVADAARAKRGQNET